MAVHIDEDRCNGCGICIRACPANAITVGEVAEVEAAVCTDCGSCIGECPNDAIFMERTDAASSPRPVVSIMPTRPVRVHNKPLQVPSRSSGAVSRFSRVNWAGILGLAFDLFIGRLATRGLGRGSGCGEGRRGGMGRRRGRRR